MCRLHITQKLGLRREKTITVPKPAKDIRTEKLNYKYIFEIFKKEKNQHTNIDFSYHSFFLIRAMCPFFQEQRKRERVEEDRRLAEMRAQEEARRKAEEVSAVTPCPVSP